MRTNKTNGPATVMEFIEVGDPMSKSERRALRRHGRHIDWQNFKARVWRFFHPRQCVAPKTSQA